MGPHPTVNTVCARSRPDQNSLSSSVRIVDEERRRKRPLPSYRMLAFRMGERCRGSDQPANSALAILRARRTNLNLRFGNFANVENFSKKAIVFFRGRDIVITYPLRWRIADPVRRGNRRRYSLRDGSANAAEDFRRLPQKGVAEQYKERSPVAKLSFLRPWEEPWTSASQA